VHVFQRRSPEDTTLTSLASVGRPIPFLKVCIVSLQIGLQTRTRHGEPKMFEDVSVEEKENYLKGVQLEADVTNLWLIIFVGLSFPARNKKKDDDPGCWSCCCSATTCVYCESTKLCGKKFWYGFWAVFVHALILYLMAFLMQNFESKGMPGCRQAEDVIKFNVVLAAKSFSISERVIGARCTAFGNIFEHLPKLEIPHCSALIPVFLLLLLHF
jgi:hypothetical protein